MKGGLISHYVQLEHDWITWQLVALIQAHSIGSQLDIQVYTDGR